MAHLKSFCRLTSVKRGEISSGQFKIILGTCLSLSLKTVHKAFGSVLTVQKVSLEFKNGLDSLSGVWTFQKALGQLVECVFSLEVSRQLKKCLHSLNFLDIDDFAFLVSHKSYSVLFIPNFVVPVMLLSGKF